MRECNLDNKIFVNIGDNFSIREIKHKMHYYIYIKNKNKNCFITLGLKKNHKIKNKTKLQSPDFLVSKLSYLYNKCLLNKSKKECKKELKNNTIITIDTKKIVQGNIVMYNGKKLERKINKTQAYIINFFLKNKKKIKISKYIYYEVTSNMLFSYIPSILSYITKKKYSNCQDFALLFYFNPKLIKNNISNIFNPK